MKIGRNAPCICGSGKKYKNCCLNKQNVDNIETMNIFAYHNSYIHTKKVKAKKINRKLLNIYDNREQLSLQKTIDDYLSIMDYILNYAKKNSIRTPDELDNENLIGDYIINVIGDFEKEIYNLHKEEYDLNKTIRYIDKLINTLDLDDNTYENNVRCKTNSLFKLGNNNLAEKVMLDLMNEKQNSIYPYVELVDDYEMIGNLEKAKYYYDLGMKQTNLKDLDVLEERIDYFQK